MRIYAIAPGDVNHKLSIAYAMRQGYSISLEADGCAQIVKADSTTYHVHNWRCDCPDARGRDGGSYTLPDNRHVCKHVSYISQVYPCKCGGLATFNTDSNWKMFLCTNCHTMRAYQLVKGERERARAEAAEVRRQADEVIRKAEEAGRAVFA